MAKPRRKQQGNKKKRTGGHPAKRSRGRSRSAEELEMERMVKLAAEHARRDSEEALSPATSPERVAELILEDFEGMPSPVGFVYRLALEVSEEQARAVAAAVARIAPGSVTALTVEAELAVAVDGDFAQAGELLDQALDADGDPNGMSQLAEHLLQAGRDLDAIGVARDALTEDPDDEDALEVYGVALERLHRQAAAGEKLTRAEHAALSGFRDRSGLYALREEMRILIEERRPELEAVIDAHVVEWFDLLKDACGDGPEAENALLGDEERSEALLRFAMEHAWLMGDEDEEEDGDEDIFELDPDLGPLRAGVPLAVLASEQSVGEPVAPVVAGLMSHALGGLLPGIVGGVWSQRAAGVSDNSMPFGASQEAVDGWKRLWPNERLPALGGATPRAAARRPQTRARLEAVLREFEHDCDALIRAGKPAPDVDALRAELGMERWWELGAAAR